MHLACGSVLSQMGLQDAASTTNNKTQPCNINTFSLHILYRSYNNTIVIIVLCVCSRVCDKNEFFFYTVKTSPFERRRDTVAAAPFKS